jgi:TM2 domain-containing membrane protein YozV
MNCANHPEVSASAFCRECGKPMCQECQKPTSGSIYCAEHLPVAAGPSFPSPPPPPRVSADSGTYASSSYTGSSPYTAPASSPYTASAPASTPYETAAHPALALILGFIPGVGAIYNGQYAKGLIHAVVFGLLVTLASNTHTAFEPFIGLMIAAWVFYMAFEAYHTAHKRQYGVSVEEFSSLFDVRATHGRFPAGALLLIGLGFILLLDTTDIISMEQLERYWPVGLILFGLYMLYARLSPAGKADRNAEAPK